MKVKIVQIAFQVGDMLNNAKKIIKAAQGDSDIVVFPELALCGYTPMDLMSYEGFWTEIDNSIKYILENSKHIFSHIVFGLPRKISNQCIYNSAMIVHQGKIVGIYNKQLLPSYDVFDEKRYFIGGDNTLILQIAGKKVGFLICEDAWFDLKYKKDPLTPYVGNVDLMISLNASPSIENKISTRLNLYKKLAKKTNCPWVYSNHLGFLDHVVFDGSSFAINQNGEYFLLDSFKETFLEFNPFTKLKGKILKHNINLFRFNQICFALREYCKANNFKRVVVGASGGIDSTLTIFLASEALGADNVTAITMPSKHSSIGSVEDSITLCKNLNVAIYNYSIINECSIALNNYETTFGKSLHGIAYENMQARMRARILMEYSNMNSALLLSTGNKSEMAVGYATLYGDMCGGVNLIGDLYKTEVWSLSKWINKHFNNKIPNNIILKAPSAELADSQLDSNSLPPYEELDNILKVIIEHKKNKILNPNSLETVRALVAKSEFKRLQAPPIVKLKNISFGFGRKILISSLKGYI